MNRQAYWPGLLKGWLLWLLHHLGVLRLLLFFYRRGVVILMFHGVMDEQAGQQWQPTWPRHTPAQLDRILAILGKYYQFVSMDEAVDMLSGKQPLKPYSMVLSFDDGYANNLSHAHPVLDAHGAPMILYVCSGMLGNGQPFWIDRLDFALQQQPGPEIITATGDCRRTLDTSRRSLLAAGYRAYRQEIKSAYANDYQMLADLASEAERLERQAGAALSPLYPSDPWSATVTVEQLAEPIDGLTIGSHTVNHVRLTRIDGDAANEELGSSKRALERHTGRPCRHFCYPNGDNDEQARHRVAAADYRSAVTSTPGINRPGDNLFALRRLPFPLVTREPDILYFLLRGCSHGQPATGQ